jgi:excisionase family DNA binding protein
LSSLRPEVTGQGPNQFEPLAVSPRQACVILNVCNSKLYGLLASGELESYVDGRSRLITLRSIRARVERLLASDGATEDVPHPRRSIRKACASAEVSPTAAE